jgi:hypothetical protein
LNRKMNLTRELTGLQSVTHVRMAKNGDLVTLLSMETVISSSLVSKSTTEKSGSLILKFPKSLFQKTVS